jgi:hypothetical protein
MGEDLRWWIQVRLDEIHSRFDIVVDATRTLPADWLFTHIRATRQPPHFEATVPLAFAGPDVLGFAVACALHRRAWPLRVAYWTGQGDDLHIGTFNGPAKDEDGDFAWFSRRAPIRLSQITTREARLCGSLLQWETTRDVIPRGFSMPTIRSTLTTAAAQKMATAFFCPTKTTSRLPLVTPV